MKLERLHLKDFRCFEHLSVEFHPKLTVLIAVNGAGKTAILDAIALGFGRYLTKLPGIKGRATQQTDLRIDHKERQAPYMALGWEVRETTGEQELLSWAGFRRRDGAVKTTINQMAEVWQTLGPKGLKEIDRFTTKIVQADSAGEAYFLPVIAYYGTNRMVRDEVKRRRGFKKQFSRFEALTDSLEPDSRFKAAFEWFNAMEDEERREKEKRRDFDYKHPALQHVRRAVETMLSSPTDLTLFKSPRTETRPLRFVIDKTSADGITRTLRISQLSDGFRVVLGLVMDLARRLALANTQIRIDGNIIVNPLDLPAIALIDEVDLHLHPSWQQRILSDLARTFPGTQFIVTTHSPQVLSTTRRENIRVLGENSAEMPLASTYGQPSGDVMHSVMLVDPQPPIQEKPSIDRLTELVDQGRWEQLEATTLMAQLMQSLGPTNARLQQLQRSINRQTMLRSLAQS
jgi:predicted ATP-binding protein involved in virulence